MKKLIHLILIVLLIFGGISLTSGNFTSAHPQVSIIQTVDNCKTVYNAPSKFEKFIAPSSRTEQTVLFRENDNNQNMGFDGFKDCLSPAGNKFSLLISYIYNKSYLSTNKKLQGKFFLTEISPNAP